MAALLVTGCHNITEKSGLWVRVDCMINDNNYDS